MILLRMLMIAKMKTTRIKATRKERTREGSPPWPVRLQLLAKPAISALKIVPLKMQPHMLMQTQIGKRTKEHQI